MPGTNQQTQRKHTAMKVAEAQNEVFDVMAEY